MEDLRATLLEFVANGIARGLDFLEGKRKKIDLTAALLEFVANGIARDLEFLK